MKLKLIIVLLSLVAGIVTVVIGLKTVDPPLSMGALGIIGFAITPYIYLIVMAKFVSRYASLVAITILAVIIGILGVWALVDSMYVEPDAQGGLAFIVIPVYQWGLLLVTTLFVYFFQYKEK